MSTTRIREAIDKQAALIAAQPEKARVKNAPATARLAGGLRFEVSGPNNEHAITDMPRGVGGDASAAAPGWYMRAAIASCTATAIAMRAARQGMELKTLEVTSESSSDNRGLLGLDDKVSAGMSPIVTRVRIGADGIAADKLRELVIWAESHSPVSCTVRQGPSMSLEVEVV